ncbi:MAG: 3'-5' exonuclease [Deltaproteobacteria bacterium]|nr:3'-5' exonuclease [Deltaproteobacteria bacterium]MBK8715961.1 3'-5' exonuclease [Deltaproteobacteria bacterium]
MDDSKQNSPVSGQRAGVQAVRAPTLDELGPRFAAFVAGLRRPVVFFDIEATGADPIADRIVEISVLRVSPLPVGIEPARTWRIDPGVRIPSEASDIHGIHNADLVGAPRFADVAAELAAVFADADLAGFSITRFDLRILQAEFVRAGRMVEFSRARLVDAQVIYHQREPRNLAAALRFYRGRELFDAHGAEADTVASLEVFAGQLERYDDLGVDLESLHGLSVQHNDAYCDTGRRFAWRDNEPVFNFGRLRGKSLRWVASDPTERAYLRWMVEGNFDEDAKDIVRDALRGRIRATARATARSA